MKASDGASEAALERSLSEWIPLDVAAATVVLREAKQILDNLGVVFFLRQGTCLGAIRDHGFIPIVPKLGWNVTWLLDFAN